MGGTGKYTSQRFYVAYLPDYVREHRLWSCLRFSRYAKPLDGTLHDQRASRSPHFLWRDDNRGNRGFDLGRRRYCFFHENGYGETNAAVVVNSITNSWLGSVGGVLAVLGVIAAPITSGDTALRSGRLIVADIFHMEQRSIKKRLLICIPIFLVTMGILFYSLKDKDGFDIVWRYFAWANQTLSVFTLWAVTVYLVRQHRGFYYLVSLLPALFMTAVCTAYICVAPEGFGLSSEVVPMASCSSALIALVWFIVWKHRSRKEELYEAA